MMPRRRDHGNGSIVALEAGVVRTKKCKSGAVRASKAGPIAVSNKDSFDASKVGERRKLLKLTKIEVDWMPEGELSDMSVLRVGLPRAAPKLCRASSQFQRRFFAFRCLQVVLSIQQTKVIYSRKDSCSLRSGGPAA
jgi:hypothetical protein